MPYESLYGRKSPPHGKSVPCLPPLCQAAKTVPGAPPSRSLPLLCLSPLKLATLHHPIGTLRTLQHAATSAARLARGMLRVCFTLLRPPRLAHTSGMHIREAASSTAPPALFVQCHTLSTLAASHRLQAHPRLSEPFARAVVGRLAHLSRLAHGSRSLSSAMRQPPSRSAWGVRLRRKTERRLRPPSGVSAACRLGGGALGCRAAESRHATSSVTCT